MRSFLLTSCIGIFGTEAADQMPVSNVYHFRVLLAAAVGRVLTARAEFATRRQIGGIRHQTFDRHKAVHVLIQLGNGVEQALCIGCVRFSKIVNTSAYSTTSPP